MNYLSFFLLAILAIGAFSLETNTKIKTEPGTELTKFRVETRRTVTTTNPRFRRWGYYGGMGGYGMGYGRMGYGMGGYGMRGFGYGYPMWG
uniref:Neuropeptide-like protein 31 n=1 Tax=Caenorhabditis tropicalis TaxID=1561998 RepID=A0A1I7T6Y7_9PELO